MSKFHDIIGKIKAVLNEKTSSFDKPAEFEQKLRKLMRNKNFNDSFIYRLMDERELRKLDFDCKSYMFRFLKLYMETKNKILNNMQFEDKFIAE